jgi:hypothetical protein
VQPGEGYGNGCRSGPLKSTGVSFSASIMRGHLKGRTQALEHLAIAMLAEGYWW